MDLKALLLIQGVIVATCLSTFVAARQLAPEPSASSPSASSSSSSLCSRPLATTLWGAAFAFFSLMADAWPAAKAMASSKSSGRSLSVTFHIFSLIAPVVPLVGIAQISREMFTTLRFRRILRSSTNPQLVPDTMSMSNKLRGLIDDILVILIGINQPQGFSKRTRIVANTFIVLGMSDSTTVPPSHINTDDSPVKEDNMAEALTLGHKTAENSCLMLLNEAGKLALLETSILPNYKQLRFLDGRSGIATFIMGVQAIGYVTSTVYRATNDLPVSPIEAIGVSFNIVVIVRSVVHSVGVICQSPLVIYLNRTQEQEMLDKCESTRWSNEDDVICRNAAKVVSYMVAFVVSFMVGFVVGGSLEASVQKKSWLYTIGPILFIFSAIPQLFLANYLDRNPLLSTRSTWGVLLWLGSVMMGGIVVSIVATILDWQTNKFDSRTPSVIHIWPFVG